jgi:hypothetical protein
MMIILEDSNYALACNDISLDIAKVSLDIYMIVNEDSIYGSLQT